MAFLAASYTEGTESFAFNESKRFYRMQSPATLKVVAPGVELDYDVVPDGQTRKAQYEEGLRRGVRRREETEIRVTEDYVVAYNGQIVTRNTGGAAGMMAEIYFGKDKTEMLTNAFPDHYLRNMGMHLVHPLREPLEIPDTLPEVFERGGYKITSQSDQIDGLPCILIERRGLDRIWCDASKGHAMVQRELFNDQSKLLDRRIIHRDFREAEPGLWLPYLTYVEHCGPATAPEALRGKPLDRSTLTTTKLEVNKVPDSEFTIKIKPGETVLDHTHGNRLADGTYETITYTMPADEAAIEEAIEKAMARVPRPWWRKHWVMVVSAAAILVLALVLAILVFRRSRQRTAA